MKLNNWRLILIKHLYFNFMENDFRYLKLPLISTTWRNSIEQTSNANNSNKSSHHFILSIYMFQILSIFVQRLRYHFYLKICSPVSCYLIPHISHFFFFLGNWELIFDEDKTFFRYSRRKSFTTRYFLWNAVSIFSVVIIYVL